MGRFLSVLGFLAGLALAFGYPLLQARLPVVPVGTWPVYTAAAGFMQVEAGLTPAQAPVAVYLDMAAPPAVAFDPDRTVLTLTASVAGRTIIAEPLTFVGAVSREDAPQTPQTIYRAKAGVIENVDPGDATYTFVTGPGDAEGIAMVKVDLVLEEESRHADPRVQPVGFMAMAVGAVGFLISLRLGGDGRPPNPNSKPPPPRWGRGAGQRRP